jgi:hypothetical protein
LNKHIKKLKETYKWCRQFPQSSTIAMQWGKTIANNVKIEKERISNRARCAAGDK